MNACVFCENDCGPYGNNAMPLRDTNKCCNRCNYQLVIPARLFAFYNKKNQPKKKSSLVMVCGIRCNSCKNELPPHTMEQHLSGDFNKVCPHY